MTASHGEGPWHDHDGPYHRPNVKRPPCRDGSCASSFSPERCNDFGRETQTGRCGVSGGARGEYQQTTLPTGGSESGERSEPVLLRPVGPGRSTNDRMEGGPTGTTDLFCCSCSGVVRYRSLHYAAAMVKPLGTSGYRQSTPNRGVSA